MLFSGASHYRYPVNHQCTSSDAMLHAGSAATNSRSSAGAHVPAQKSIGDRAEMKWHGKLSKQKWVEAACQGG